MAFTPIPIPTPDENKKALASVPSAVTGGTRVAIPGPSGTTTTPTAAPASRFTIGPIPTTPNAPLTKFTAPQISQSYTGKPTERGILSPVVDTWKKSPGAGKPLQLAIDIAQALPRAAGSLTLSALKKKELPAPDENASIAEKVLYGTLFGKRPVKNIGGTGEELLTSFGFKESTASKYAIPVGILSVVTDLWPPGKFKKPLEQLAKETDTKVIRSILGKLGIAGKDADELAPLLSTAKTVDEVKSIIKGGSLSNAQLKTEIQTLETFLKESPARQLSKYANPNGELPEVIGGTSAGGRAGATSKFGKQGDTFVTELGFADSEEARAAYASYREGVAQLQKLKEEYARMSVKPGSLKRVEIPGPTSVVSENALIQEARKYKTAEEFVNKYYTPESYDFTPGMTRLEKLPETGQYHGAGVTNLKSIINDGVIKAKISALDTTGERVVSLSGNRGVAGSYGPIFELKNPVKVVEPKAGTVKGDYYKGFEYRASEDIPLSNIESVTLPINKAEGLNTKVLWNYSGKTPEYITAKELGQQLESKGIKVIYDDGLLADKSRLTDMWNKANKVKPEEPLITEARKYKTAEEFVKAQPTLYHGTMSDIKSLDVVKKTGKIGGEGVVELLGPSLSTSKNVAKSYGDNILEVNFIPKNVKTFDSLQALKEDIAKSATIKLNETRSSYQVISDRASAYKKMLQSQGYDAISFPEGKIGESIGVGERTIIPLIDDISLLKTKSQLTDIWNKANVSKPTTRIDLTPTKAVAPKVATKAPTTTTKSVLEMARETVNKQAAQAIQDRELAKAFVEGKDSNSLFALAKRAIAPTKNIDPAKKKVYDEWKSNLIKARISGQETIRDMSTMGKTSIKTILDYESGKAIPAATRTRDTFNGFYREAKQANMNMDYLRNFLPQVYDAKPAQIIKAVTKYLKSQGLSDDLIEAYVTGARNLDAGTSARLKLSPSFTKHRVFPSYKIAMQYGLKPKYNTIPQLAGYYKEELNKAIANRDFLQKLIDEGHVMYDLPGLPKSWKEVNIPFSTQRFYAEPKFAKLLNGIFDDSPTFLGEIVKGVSFLSRRTQELALSAGAPYTNINFFTAGQLLKEMTAGNLKSVSAFIRSNFNGASQRFFMENIPTMKKMADYGIDLGDHVGSLAQSYKNLNLNRGLTKVLGEQFDKAFNEKTFASFMPQMYVQLFKDAEKVAVRRGLKGEAASEFAAQVVKNSFGLMEDVGRAGKTQDTISALFFAPKFRESLVNVIIDTARSVTTKIGDPTFYRNRRLIAGLAVMYGVYNYVNKKLNGNYMWENEPGKEGDLKIPLNPEAFEGLPDWLKKGLDLPTKDGQYMYLAFMPSFLAFPRNLFSGTKALVTGDFSTAKQKFGSLFSMPLKIGAELSANKDYFGREIWKETDSPETVTKKVALYLGLQANHPYIKEFIKQKFTQTDKPLYQSISEALELPFKFSSWDKISQAQYYEMLEKQNQIRARNRELVMPKYEEMKRLATSGDAAGAARYYQSLTEQERLIIKDIITSEKSSETFRVKTATYSKYLEIKALAQSGQVEEAQRLVAGLSAEERKAFESLIKAEAKSQPIETED